MTIAADRSSELFIDGHLLPGNGGRFPTLNPATEEVLGTAADASSRPRRPAGRSTPSHVSPTGQRDRAGSRPPRRRSQR